MLVHLKKPQGGGMRRQQHFEAKPAAAGPVMMRGHAAGEQADTIGDAHAVPACAVANPARLPEAIGAALCETQILRERKTAHAELMHTREELRALRKQFDLALDEERASIAREIHDELGALLTAAKIELASIERNARSVSAELGITARSIESLIDGAMSVSQRISRRLRPAILDHGIVAAVEWLARDFSKRLGLKCTLALDVEDIELPAQSANAIFHIFQEALTNIARHAGASSFSVRLGLEPDGALLLTVIDDGRGIAAQDLHKPGSFGLRNMRERCFGIGGRLDIQPAAGSGTQLTLRVPR